MKIHELPVENIKIVSHDSPDTLNGNTFYIDTFEIEAMQKELSQPTIADNINGNGCFNIYNQQIIRLSDLSTWNLEIPPGSISVSVVPIWRTSSTNTYGYQVRPWINNSLKTIVDSGPGQTHFNGTYFNGKERDPAKPIPSGAFYALHVGTHTLKAEYFETQLLGSSTLECTATVTVNVSYALPHPSISGIITNNAPNISWSATNNATSYNVYRKLIDDNNYTLVMNTTNTSITDYGVEIDIPNEDATVSVFYYVKSKNSSNELSLASNAIEFSYDIKFSGGGFF